MSQYLQRNRAGSASPVGAGMSWSVDEDDNKLAFSIALAARPMLETELVAPKGWLPAGEGVNPSDVARGNASGGSDGRRGMSSGGS